MSGIVLPAAHPVAGSRLALGKLKRPCQSQWEVSLSSQHFVKNRGDGAGGGPAAVGPEAGWGEAAEGGGDAECLLCTTVGCSWPFSLVCL